MKSRFQNKKGFHQKRKFNRGNDSTSWEGVSKRYNKIVGDDGHYFHRHVIMPKAIPLLGLEEHSAVLDLACGQGILSREIPRNNEYLGLDISPSLIQASKARNKIYNFHFEVADVTKPLPTKRVNFTHAAIILALQNIEDMNAVFKNAYDHLVSGGKFLIILNHPAFRIPRQSSWGIDDKNKMQYRRINRYQTPLKIPIDMEPGSTHQITWSFHNPISTYFENLNKNGFYVEKLEEWTSNKESVGKAAKMENLAREEFPMFMAILAVKK